MVRVPRFVEDTICNTDECSVAREVLVVGETLGGVSIVLTRRSCFVRSFALAHKAS